MFAASETMKIKLLSSAVFLSVAFAVTSCNGQVQTKDSQSNNQEETKQSPLSDKEIAKYMAELQALVDAGIDPYFVETKDTISTYGPNHITRDLLQDKNGKYWFATWHGIMSYDGKLFTNHTLKEGLIHFHVLSCYEDKKGNLWFGTARGGLYLYDGRSFKLFTKKDGLADNTVVCFAEDNAGNIWFGTENGGASRYDGKTFTNFTMKEGLCTNNVSAIIQDKTGKLWFGCLQSKYMADDGGISCYDASAEFIQTKEGLGTGSKAFTKFTNKDGSPFKGVTSLLEDRSGNIWIGKSFGLTLYDGQSFTDLLSNYLTYYIIEDKAGNIWFTHCEPSGSFHPTVPNQILYRYDASTEFIQTKEGPSKGPKIFTKVIEKYEPGDHQLFGKIEDKDGNIWFGTMHGPCRYDGKKFTYFFK